ncbi:MAG TPA: type II toxin-antitoxin system VapC family toxin [Thermoanaerobaculia bacterium]|nr:type II toxin-antitoxin system VapC family toxin [Thermoanaerobaculia bacterium]
MRLLADTHVLLWSATDPAKLNQQARAAIEDGSNDIRVSTVSVWEIAIKQSLGKLDLPRPAEQWLPDVLRRTGFEVADVTVSAALRVRGMAWHHRDPFDRLLIAHALEEGYTIVTRDDVFEAYGVAVLPA